LTAKDKPYHQLGTKSTAISKAEAVGLDGIRQWIKEVDFEENKLLTDTYMIAREYTYMQLGKDPRDPFIVFLYTNREPVYLKVPITASRLLKHITAGNNILIQHPMI